MHKIGFVHIPKTAGNSINTLICAAIGQKHVHIAKMWDSEPAEPLRPLHLVSNSLAAQFAQNNPYLSGHVSYAQMASLERTFVFTVLRDPFKQFLSLYTYIKTRQSRGIALDFNASIDFIAFARQPHGQNMMAKQLLIDTPHNPRCMAHSMDLVNQQILDIFHNEAKLALERFDAVYSCDPQQVVNDLARRSLIPVIAETKQTARLNLSDDDVSFGQLTSAEEFLDEVRKATFWDRELYKVAQSLYPDTLNEPVLDDDGLISYVRSRFGITFGD